MFVPKTVCPGAWGALPPKSAETRKTGFRAGMTVQETGVRRLRVLWSSYPYLSTK